MPVLDYPHIHTAAGEPARMDRLPRIRVAQIVADHLGHGWSAKEIVRHHPPLTPAEVHAALGYYFDHTEEIDSELAAELSELNHMARQPPSPLRLLALACAPAERGRMTFYFDVYVPAPIADQLRRRGVDVLTAKEDGAAELPDPDLLARSTALGRVLFTQNIRFKSLAQGWQRDSRPFAGLIFGHQLSGSIGQYVRDLEHIAKATEPQEWVGRVEKAPFS